MVALLAIWKVATPPLTSLHNLTLTDDNKSFPSGQLTWSQKFTPFPCGKSPAGTLSRGCHFDIVPTAWIPPKSIDNEPVSKGLKEAWIIKRHSDIALIDSSYSPFS
ncbi:hypothetical protein ETB97_003910 [Aspergillus alliaceus]|uniref:Uncharacterized protein n=1 Tax=Petromyces alliaceus TaxID=209559 RepID=A0A8H6A207_PETAA|nr:hypothetical protein ETB97_003910 [Aspergillus burnettii]